MTLNHNTLFQYTTINIAQGVRENTYWQMIKLPDLGTGSIVHLLVLGCCLFNNHNLPLYGILQI